MIKESQQILRGVSSLDTLISSKIKKDYFNKI